MRRRDMTFGERAKAGAINGTRGHNVIDPSGSKATDSAPFWRAYTPADLTDRGTSVSRKGGPVGSKDK
ncbi:Hypothetical protein NTJ_09816 [Nesidiocoris tenuis]|uniref:Uncharacterized protein n=1 Tax=Nesidiocoris tenuis TaxID=355587 RepID=A0ABN7AXW9_9HEMI|nr:Hypothetical protein NTJ_09816 [Nesidiocoris tenuis]